MLDLIIVGSGPAALTAAIYASRADLSVLVLERAKVGGELGDISHIANFPGFSGTGADLAAKMRAQAESFGTKIEYAEVTKLANTDGYFTITADGGEKIARAVLLATGSEPLKLPFTPAAPVSYCALCDAALYEGKDLLVIGGGNSAIGESLMLAKIAKHVTIMTHSTVKAEPKLVNSLSNYQNVEIIEHTEPNLENTAGYDGIFVYIGKRPATQLLAPEQIDAKGYAKTTNFSHEVSPGLFAAGDVRAGTTKQAIVAAADGAEAAIEIIDYLGKHGK